MNILTAIPLIDYAESQGVDCQLSPSGKEWVLEFPNGARARISYKAAKEVLYPDKYLAKVFKSLGEDKQW